MIVTLGRRRDGRCGFSLIEIVVVLFLTSVILLAVGSLTQKTLDSLKFLREKSDSMMSATLGCERLAGEMREMVQVPDIDPARSIRFRKVNPNSSPALGNNFQDETVSPPHLWARDYVAAGQTVEVFYDAPGEVLTRSLSGGPAIPVAANVNTFNVAPLAGPPGAFTVTLAIREKRKVATFTTIVYCPGIPRL